MTGGVQKKKTIDEPCDCVKLSARLYSVPTDQTVSSKMAHLRRSTHASTSRVFYTDEYAPCYPDQAPVNDFERQVASLNQQSFRWKQLSAVDDVLVYSLFSTKQRSKGYRAVKTERAFGEEDSAVTAKEGIDIRKKIEEYLPGEKKEGLCNSLSRVDQRISGDFFRRAPGYH